MNKMELDLKEFWPLINETISTGGEFRLFHKGTSMMPLLRQGIDSVLLVSPTNIKKNDIVLYERPSGQLVMHRIIKVKRNSYLICGDNQYILEKGITDANMLAKVKGIYRGEEYFDIENKQYKKYVRKLPIRRFKIKLLYALGINK
ncbi:MAG: S24/S26 family peptidase [Clostridia bacterium]|nr:S24/S26 family peptidase [Clostridia bacterium]